MGIFRKMKRQTKMNVLHIYWHNGLHESYHILDEHESNGNIEATLANGNRYSFCVAKMRKYKICVE